MSPVALSPELTCPIVLVVIDEDRDRVKHIFFSHIVSLGVVICFFDVIMLDTGVVLTSNKGNTNAVMIKKQH
jgi:Ethanolamine utilization protein EutJ (predicted chaperonin)